MDECITNRDNYHTFSIHQTVGTLRIKGLNHRISAPLDSQIWLLSSQIKPILSYFSIKVIFLSVIIIKDYYEIVPRGEKPLSVCNSGGLERCKHPGFSCGHAREEMELLYGYQN